MFSVYDSASLSSLWFRHKDTATWISQNETWADKDSWAVLPTAGCLSVFLLSLWTGWGYTTEYLDSFRSIPLSIPTRETQFDLKSVSWEQVRLHFSGAGETESAQRRIRLNWQTRQKEVYILSVRYYHTYIHHTIKDDVQPNYKKATGGHVQDVHGRELDRWTECSISPLWSEAETWRSKRAAKTQYPVITVPVRAAGYIPLYHHQTDGAINKTEITPGRKRSPPQQLFRCVAVGGASKRWATRQWSHRKSEMSTNIYRQVNSIKATGL